MRPPGPEGVAAPPQVGGKDTAATEIRSPGRYKKKKPWPAAGATDQGWENIREPG
jgi:hypothetical protein